MKLLTVLRAVRATLLGVWLGGIVMIFIAAPIVFETLSKDRALAGAIVGRILHTGALVKLGIALATLGIEAIIFFQRGPDAPKGWRRFVPTAALLLAMVNMLFVLLWLEPKIHEVRSRILDLNAAPATDPNRIEFGKYHGLSMALALLEAALVLVALLAGLL